MSQTGQPPEVIRVAIIEDRREIREGLAMLIGGTPGFACSGNYRSMEDALPRIKAGDLPDVVLCDIGLPGMSGIEGMRILKERFPNLLLLMLTVYDDDERIFDALCAGACGYLLKKTPPSRLLESLREAVQGGSPMSPEVARRVIALFRDIRPPERADYELTPHETRLLKLLVEGHNYKTAAVELQVSVNTVSFHMRRIYEKLQVHSKSEAVAKALRDRLVN
jgi:DNA-binding NarL/FixJ family response regulator